MVGVHRLDDRGKASVPGCLVQHPLHDETSNPGDNIAHKTSPRAGTTGGLVSYHGYISILVATTAGPQTLTGKATRKSPQADALLAYEHALIEGGLKAAIPYMTSEKLTDLKGMAEAFGEDGFNEFLDRMRGGAQGEAQRKQIMSVAIDGDHAVLEVRDKANTVPEQHLDRTKDGWKVGTRLRQAACPRSRLRSGCRRMRRDKIDQTNRPETIRTFSPPTAAVCTLFRSSAIPCSLLGCGFDRNRRLNRTLEGHRRYLARPKG
ncbi:hypothetical protein [Nitrobacter sp. 62-13]|uniref:hypothetical protein n=1 Tax=Nitrobacter sp. 62-13 TaxID=1895797 RepID=UPI0025E75683|nr:hypothetical protein [Nitrobacter sp. 62-13]